MEVHADPRHAVEGAQLLGDRADAVAAGHAGDAEGLGGHERTSRAMASEASRTFSSASRPAASGRVDDAVLDVLVEELEGERLQRLGRRRTPG